MSTSNSESVTQNSETQTTGVMAMYTDVGRRTFMVSSEELERRWALVRAGMRERGIDVLLMKSDTDFFGGYLRYFTDIAAIGGTPITAIFPRDDLMTVVRHGPPGDRALPDGPAARGVGRIVTHPSYTTLSYRAQEEVDLIGKVLQPYSNATIGLLGIHQLSWALVDHLRRIHVSVRWVDAADFVDPIKARKSTEEQEFLGYTATLQDSALEAAFAAIRPGMRERDITAVARHVSFQLGSEQGIYLCGSAPAGRPSIPMVPSNQTRVIEEGDIVTLMIENSGPGGYYTHIMRTCSVGRPPSQRVVDEFELCLEAQRRTVARLQPGADPVEISEIHNAFLRENGRPEETRNYCHSQGYDALERPVFQPGETLRVEAGMNIGCHPNWVHNGVQMWLCDNFIVGKESSRRLHSFPQAIRQL